MARKETIYTVSKADNIILRASRNMVSAHEFATTLKGVYTCTSEFQDLKKGAPISNITAFLASF